MKNPRTVPAAAGRRTVARAVAAALVVAVAASVCVSCTPSPRTPTRAELVQRVRTDPSFQAQVLASVFGGPDEAAYRARLGPVRNRQVAVLAERVLADMTSASRALDWVPLGLVSNPPSVTKLATELAKALVNAARDRGYYNVAFKVIQVKWKTAAAAAPACNQGYAGMCLALPR